MAQRGRRRTRRVDTRGFLSTRGRGRGGKHLQGPCPKYAEAFQGASTVLVGGDIPVVVHIKSVVRQRFGRVFQPERLRLPPHARGLPRAELVKVRASLFRNLPLLPKPFLHHEDDRGRHGRAVEERRRRLRCACPPKMIRKAIFLYTVVTLVGEKQYRILQ